MNNKNNDKMKIGIIVTLILMLVAAIYTILVKYVDVQAIGPNGSSVGFATINSFVLNHLGSNETCYKITKYLGYLPIVFALIYAVIGFIQLIKKKSLAKVDKEFLALGVFYIVVAAIYIFFENCIVNYRPILENGVLEASYPSSHTLMSICLCGSSILLNNKLFKDNKLAKLENVISIALILIIVIGRLASGVHWFSDILGGVIISITILTGFGVILNSITSTKEQKLENK